MAQRVSAVVLAAYFLFLLGYLVANPGIGFADWHGLFSQGWMRIFSLLAVVALSVHAWVGMWTISTDYLTPMAFGKSATAVRFLFQAVCGIAMFAFFVWGVQILWGI
jgi:succinate dehydrogenase / fumarate reductase membrane anchor subunit